MIDIKGLTLVYTDRCNAFCEHCGSACGPDKGGKMSVKDAESYIESASKIDGLRMICFTGGEPMLYSDEILEVMAFANELGLNSELVTNSFWAEDYVQAFKTLERLKENGLMNFVTSLDDYHIAYIEAESVINAVAAALNLGLRVTLKTLEFEGCKIKAHAISELIGKDFSRGDFHLQKIKAVHEGRYKTHDDMSERPDLKVNSSRLKGGCGKIIKFPSINHLGDLYPCCGFGDSSRFVGNCLENNPLALMKEMQDNLLFNLIAEIGPYEVLGLASRFSSHKIEPISIHPCEICNQLFASEDLRSKVRMVMDRLISV